jgi:glycosyltransferase involved in cell wall biosynthesis
VQNSQGKYIAFLDDDDEWLPEKLQKQVDLLDSSPPVVGAVYTGFLKIDRLTGEMLAQIVPTKRGCIFHEMFIQNWVGTPSTVLLRKECFEKVGVFDEELVFGTDYDMWIRISKEFRFEYISDPLVHYYVHDNNLSTNYEIVVRGMEISNRKYEKHFALHRRHHSDRFHTIGVFYCLSGNIRKGREALLTAIRLYPFDARYYFRLFVSLLGAESFKKTNELKERVTAWIKK